MVIHLNPVRMKKNKSNRIKIDQTEELCREWQSVALLPYLMYDVQFDYF